MAEEKHTGPIEGGCLCGAVRYEVDGAGITHGPGHCHCAMCRRASGAVALTWFTCSPEAFRVTKGEMKRYRSSPHARRGFCGDCGTPIAFMPGDPPTEIDVALGSLDDPAAMPADRHIWALSRLPWLRLDEHLPSHDRETEA